MLLQEKQKKAKKGKRKKAQKTYTNSVLLRWLSKNEKIKKMDF